jgi:GAF domain-containing protein
VKIPYFRKPIVPDVRQIEHDLARLRFNLLRGGLIYIWGVNLLALIARLPTDITRQNFLFTGAGILVMAGCLGFIYVQQFSPMISAAGLVIAGILSAVTIYSGNGIDFFIFFLILLAAGIALVTIYLAYSFYAMLRKSEGRVTTLDNERFQLEHQLLEQTEKLEHRLVQLRTAADISRTISSVLDPQTLLNQVVELVRQRFDLYYVGVFLTDEEDISQTGIRYIRLKAGTGEAGQKMVAEEHKFSPDDPKSMIAWSVAHRQPRIALDVGVESVRFNNPYLPLTRSEMAIPLISGVDVLGAMTVQSAKAMGFDQEDVIILKAIGDSLSTALANARLFQQLQTSLVEIRTLNQQYIRESWRKVETTSGNLSYTYVNPDQSQARSDTTPFVIPMALREQQIGSLTLEMDQTEIAAADKAFIDEVITQAVLAMENVRLLDETQRHAGQDRFVADITRRARSSTDIESILQMTLHELGRSLNASDGQIFLKAPMVE